MRKLIAAMKISIDGKMEGPEGYADWVDAWSEDCGRTPQIDACVLGAAMYRGYEPYWTGIQNEPDKPAWITGSAPTPAEVQWVSDIRRGRRNRNEVIARRAITLTGGPAKSLSLRLAGRPQLLEN